MPSLVLYFIYALSLVLIFFCFNANCFTQHTRSSEFLCSLPVLQTTTNGGALLFNGGGFFSC